MKITITGSLGNISRPLTKELVQKGHAVTVVSSNPEKQKDIDALGATAAIGTLEDANFLVDTFKGADAVYCMIPPAHNAEPDRVAYYRKIGRNYAQAIRQSGVTRVVHLSSFGADLDKGTGIILGAHHVEVMLNELPGTDITHIRPTYFYYNLFSFIKPIKQTGFMAANYGEDKIALVSPVDIAAAIVEEIVTPATAVRNVRYIASDELTGTEIAGILGVAIGMPSLKWITITNDQMQRGMEANGVPTLLAANLVEMYASLHSGALSRDYNLNKPAIMGKVKLSDFAIEFAAAFKQN